MIQRLICLVLGYTFGLFQTGYLVGLLKRRDIRNYGSGNSGTTNALRVFGKKAGVIVFIGDFFKCFIACSSFLSLSIPSIDNIFEYIHVDVS